MKKIFLALMCVAAFAMIGCSNDPAKGGTDPAKVDPEKVDGKTEKCWVYTYSETLNGVSRTINGTLWCTEKELVEEAQTWIASSKEVEEVYGVKYTIEVKYKEFTDAEDEASCKKQDKAYEEEYDKNNLSCWEMDYILTKDGQKIYEGADFVWSDKFAMELGKLSVEAYAKELGATAETTYKQADADSEEACDALNKQ